MVRVVHSGTEVGFVPRKTFEQLAQIKPPNLKFVPRDATAAFDAPHFSQWVAITNSPDPNYEMMVRDMYDQAALQRTIQQLNINGQRFGVNPRAAPVVPPNIQANTAEMRRQQDAAVAHERRTLLETRNNFLANRLQQRSMGHAASGPDLADQSKDSQTAAKMGQAQPGQAQKPGAASSTGKAVTKAAVWAADMWQNSQTPRGCLQR